MAPSLALAFSLDEARDQASGRAGFISEVWKNCNPYYVLAGVGAAAGAVAAGYYWWPRGLRVEVDPIRVSPEGLIPGKPLMEGGRVPSYQVKIAYKREDSTYVVLGAGVRVMDHLITPAHNALSGRPLYIMGKDYQYQITSTEIHLAADVVAFEVPEVVWSRLGVAKAKLAPLGAPRTVSVVSSCDGKYSVGKLSAITPMGRVKYDSSTMPGFSGSAYADGQSCLGMHCHGGIYAGGYEILYLYARLKHALKKPDESSEDFMKKLTKGKRRLIIEELDDEYAVVRDENGQYHLTDRQIRERIRELEQASASDWADETELEQLRREQRDRDYADVYFDEDGTHTVYKQRGGRRAGRQSTAYSTDYAGIGEDDDFRYIAESAEFTGESQQPATAPKTVVITQGQPTRSLPDSRILDAAERRRLTNQVESLTRINARLKKQLVSAKPTTPVVVTQVESQQPGTSTGPPKQQLKQKGKASTAN